MSTIKYLVLLVGLVGFLSACSEEPDPKAPVVLNPVASSQALSYEASLAEGIDFKKPGYPSFLANVSGMHGHEDWGRWTDGPIAKFRFKQPLPSKFTLLIHAGAFGPNLGKPIIVRAGKLEKEFTFKDPVHKEVSLNFEGVIGTDTIEIVVPKPVRPKDIDPKNGDDRLIGIGMDYLKIQ